MSLLYLRAEKRVLFKSRFVLDYNRRNAESFKGADGVDKMLGKSSRIAVKDNGLCSYLGDVLYRAESGGHIHQLYIGLSLCGGVAEGGDPHGVKLVKHTVVRNYGFFRNQPRYSAVNL